MIRLCSIELGMVLDERFQVCASRCINCLDRFLSGLDTLKEKQFPRTSGGSFSIFAFPDPSQCSSIGGAENRFQLRVQNI